jgi:hypothetical protein
MLQREVSGQRAGSAMLQRAAMVALPPGSKQTGIAFPLFDRNAIPVTRKSGWMIFEAYEKQFGVRCPRNRSIAVGLSIFICF